MSNKYAAFKKSTVEKNLSVKLYNAIFEFAATSTDENREKAQAALHELCEQLEKPVPVWDNFYRDASTSKLKGNAKDGIHKFIKVKSPSTMKRAILAQVYTMEGEQMTVPDMVEKGKGGKKSDTPTWKVIYAGFSMERKIAYAEYKADKEKAKILFGITAKLDEKFTFPTFEEWEKTHKAA